MFPTRFAAPAGLTETSNQALADWSSRLSTLFDDVVAPSRRFYNPAKSDTPVALRTVVVLAA